MTDYYRGKGVDVVSDDTVTGIVPSGGLTPW